MRQERQFLKGPAYIGIINIAADMAALFHNQNPFIFLRGNPLGHGQTGKAGTSYDIGKIHKLTSFINKEHILNFRILIHNYGPHIFHTNDREVYEYLGRFTKWNDFWHRVLTQVDGNLIPMPITPDIYP